MLNLLASFLSFVALLLQLLAILGDVSTRISTIYYFRLDLTQSGNSFTTSIEHQLGDPDFVTFGLFGFCEGYYGQGVTFCSPPTIGYDFDEKLTRI
ncbi:actin cortical patch SUR7/pH-response regulator pali [Endogone sp. FLAS-F59071]|nr:actin cortical patch SUR7/pH-response regulator pali [Endogone sp. FLAS-F59071]|eukprot:RUS21704.1 actin cortical patch SUR7/pH-response regulator pali [Endogone sp. FLAS-F59071]